MAHWPSPVLYKHIKLKIKLFPPLIDFRERGSRGGVEKEKYHVWLSPTHASTGMEPATFCCMERHSNQTESHQPELKWNFFNIAFTPFALWYLLSILALSISHHTAHNALDYLEVTKRIHLHNLYFLPIFCLLPEMSYPAHVAHPHT